MSKLFIVVFEMGIEPLIEGPFKSDKKRLKRAQKIIDGDRMASIARLSIKGGVPDIECFTGAEIDT